VPLRTSGGAPGVGDSAGRDEGGEWRAARGPECGRGWVHGRARALAMRVWGDAVVARATLSAAPRARIRLQGGRAGNREAGEGKKGGGLTA
jgi:hypothetical protein